MNNLPGELLESLKKVGLSAPIWERAVTPEEIQYFLDHWPFLQLLSLNTVETLPTVEWVTAKSNWTILNYGDAMASSPGQFLWGGGDFRIREVDGDGGGDLLNPGKGTVWRQAFDTAMDMVALAQKLGWTGIHIVDGHAIMKWAIWMSALDAGIDLDGFTPSERDIARRERVKRSAIEDIRRFHHRP